MKLYWKLLKTYSSWNIGDNQKWNSSGRHPRIHDELCHEYSVYIGYANQFLKTKRTWFLSSRIQDHPICFFLSVTSSPPSASSPPPSRNHIFFNLQQILRNQQIPPTSCTKKSVFFLPGLQATLHVTTIATIIEFSPGHNTSIRTECGKCMERRLNLIHILKIWQREDASWTDRKR